MQWHTKNGRVSIGDTDMDYVSFGHGSRVLVILPGLSDGLLTVKGKALFLAKPYTKYFEQYTVYMFSRKNRMLNGYSIRDMAADQAQALKELGVSYASIMGVSQGGMIAQFLAIDYPDLVEKLVIVVSAPRVNDTIHGVVNEWIRMAQTGDHRSLMIDTAEKGYSAKYLKRYRKLYPIIGMVGKPRNYHRFLVNAKAILDFNAYEELHKIVCPTYIIAGAEDKTVGVRASYELKEKVVQSKMYIYQGLGHAAYEEASDFYDRVLDILTE